jgi:hypothetical protein
VGRHEPDASGSRFRSMDGYCEHDNEPSGSIKFRDFIDWMSDY